MWQDPIVEETLAARKEIVEECGEESTRSSSTCARAKGKYIEDVVPLDPNEPEPESRHVAAH